METLNISYNFSFQEARKQTCDVSLRIEKRQQLDYM
jgi:hypothetical protein